MERVFVTPTVTEVVPEWRKPKPHLKLALGRLAALPSLPDNVFVLRPPVTPSPEAA